MNKRSNRFAARAFRASPFIALQIILLTACGVLADDRDRWQKPDEVIKALGLKPGMVVVDIGAGEGYFTWRFAVAVGPQGKAIGAEISRSDVRNMTADARRRGLANYEARLVPSDDPQLERQSVDVIFLCDTYHHIENRVPYFTRVKEALRPGGRLAIIDYPEDGTAHSIKKQIVIDELKEAGFSVIEDHSSLLPRQFFLTFEPANKSVIDKPVEVPAGTEPVFDGVIGIEEWKDARAEQMSEGGELFFKQDGEFLYVAIKARTAQGIASICISKGDSIYVLHASAALGTAIYEKGESAWSSKRNFSWCCRETTLSTKCLEERAKILQVDGWFATVGRMGEPNEYEYKISLQLVDPGNNAIMFAFDDLKSEKAVHWWPKSLKDDSTNLKLIRGPLPATLQFEPSSWANIKYKK